MLRLIPAQFSKQARFTKPVNGAYYTDKNAVHCFDQNGYQMTMLEKEHAYVNNVELDQHQHEQWSIRKPWFEDSYKNSGCHINHAALFERWGFDGEALERLKAYSLTNPLLYKLINLKPKWGVDFSMDYVDDKGVVFEVYHMEWDSFDREEADEMRIKIQKLVKNTDWSDAAKRMWAEKDKWINLEYDQMSNWKCDFLGAPRERYKMALWDNG